MTFDPILGPALIAITTFALLEALAFADTDSPRKIPDNGWDAKSFAYSRTASVTVEATTPTAAQIDWRTQPPKLPANQKPPVARDAKPVVAEGMNVTRLRFRDLEGEDVPALLVTPAQGKGPFPVIVALHGLRSHKAQVVAQVAPALTKKGFAVLAPDLPLHGERPGDPGHMFDQGDIDAFITRIRQAVQTARLCIDVAEQRPELDARSGVVLVGYSFGGILNSIAGPADPRVKAMCLLVGGTVEFPPMFDVLPSLAALQPQLAIPHFAGPLLMINGKHDTTVTRDMATRLFSAAAEPKEQLWYDCGHYLPDTAYAKAAEWVAEQWKTLSHP